MTDKLDVPPRWRALVDLVQDKLRDLSELQGEPIELTGFEIKEGTLWLTPSRSEQSIDSFLVIIALASAVRCEVCGTKGARMSREGDEHWLPARCGEHPHD